MANQPQQLTLPPPRTYTRTDFTALRAFVQRLPVATIARLYYDPERSPHAASADAMARFLCTMRDDLSISRCFTARRCWLSKHLPMRTSMLRRVRMTGWPKSIRRHRPT